MFYKLRLKYLQSLHNEAVRRGDSSFVKDLEDAIEEIENSKGASNKTIGYTLSLLFLVMVIGFVSQ